MEFRALSSSAGIDRTERDVIFMWNTGWDDWYQFATSYTLFYVDSSGGSNLLGDIKLAHMNMDGAKSDTNPPPGVRSPLLPQEPFTDLPVTYFSVGQDDSFYEKLNELGDDLREFVLQGMRDIAYDPKARRIAMNEKVTTTSLLRSVTMKTVEDQFARMAHGGARLTPYAFTYLPNGAAAEPRLNFSVTPGSRPPSNIHVLIGRNGVGKSTQLDKLADRMVTGSRQEPAKGGPWDQLSNIVSVSFSAFDKFKPMSVPKERVRGLTYHYVGLKKVNPKEGESELKDDRARSSEMTKSLKQCLVGARRARLRKALGLLESDPIFAEAGLAQILELPLADNYETPEAEQADDEAASEAIAEFGVQFRELSSGHKIVLLSITKLVETVEERSLVLLDEPEAHLHPPLLSAFIRALSDLLTNRNGMAIIATHSPVVLQEVPKGCVWKLSRSGNNLQAARPRIETFGENVGILTDEVFGLEVAFTGFHRMLADAAMSASTYEEALATFGGELGSEGRSILRAMMLNPAATHVAG